MTLQDFLRLLLEDWVPAVFTVAVGGYLGSIYFPKWASSYQVNKQRAERRAELAEKVIKGFSRYTISLRRLIQISSLELERALSEEEQSRKKEFVGKRNDRRDELVDKLDFFKLYFSEDTGQLVSQFFAWDEALTANRVSELPPLQDWRDRGEKIVISIGRVLQRA